MKSLEIFRPGKFTAMSGQVVEFSAADLQAIATAYDPKVHEAPLCVGHPVSDAPAYGWVNKLEFTDGRLVATPDQLEPQFSEMVKDGRFKKRSASFYSPTNPDNPTPGTWQLKHVAFLGATAPAVKGLKEVSFAGTGEGVVTVEFSESDDLWGLSSAMRSMAAFARGIREFLIADKGQEEADRLAPNWQIDDMSAQAERLAEKARSSSPNFSESPTEAELKTQAEIEAAAADVTRRENEVAAREETNKARELQFSEAARTTARKDHERLLDDLIAAGKFAPAMKASTLEFMGALDGVQTFEFAEGETKIKKTPAVFFAELLGKSGTIVNFAEVSADKDKTTAGDLDPQVLANKALAFQEEQRGKGIDITIEQAVRSVAKA